MFPSTISLHESKGETISGSSAKRVRLTFSGSWRVVVEILISADYSSV
jgi:hypothetical protein